MPTRPDLPHRYAGGLALADPRPDLAAHSGGWVESFRERGAIIIDATAPLDEVVAAVIAAAEGQQA